MSLTFVVGIVVILTWAIYIIVIGASGIIADKVTKILKEEHLRLINKNGRFISFDEMKKRIGL